MDYYKMIKWVGIALILFGLVALLAVSCGASPHKGGTIESIGECTSRQCGVRFTDGTYGRARKTQALVGNTVKN